MDIELLTLDKTPKIIRRGVLRVAKKPIYIVELIEDDEEVEPYVVVYDVQPGSNPPEKAFNRKEINKGFKNTTVLGELAKKQFRVKKKYKAVENPPLFMAPIIDGTGTFTQQFGRGFYEREKDVLKLTESGNRVIYGAPTGVFINLSSIDWIKAFIATEDIIKEQNAMRTLWYDI